MFPLEQGAFEMLVIGAIALIVVGPKDLPVLMRKVGQFTAKMRGMANEFRASFDEMARQSELDELRREVEALRTGQPTSSAGELAPPAPAIGEAGPLASGSNFVPGSVSAPGQSDESGRRGGGDGIEPSEATQATGDAVLREGRPQADPARAGSAASGDAVVLSAAALAAEPAPNPPASSLIGSERPAPVGPRSKSARAPSDPVLSGETARGPPPQRKPRAPRARAEPAQEEPR